MKSPYPTATIFDETINYWQEIAEARPTDKQVNFVKEKIEGSGLVLDLGCGNGRHTIPLSKAGYDIIGLDVSKRLLQAAKQKATAAGTKVTLVRADMRCLPFSAETFTSVISLDTSFGYFPSRDDAQRTLGEIDRTLSGNGVLLLDVFNREHIVKHHTKRLTSTLQPILSRLLIYSPFLAGMFKWREFPSFCMQQHRSVMENGLKLRDIWIFREKRTGKLLFAQHVVWLYSYRDLESELWKAGFQNLDVFGNYEGVDYGEDTDRLIVISHKK